MFHTHETVKTAHLMHEMILALTGIDTLFTARDPTIPDYNRALLEPSEAELMHRILEFGKKYKEIQEYIAVVNAERLKDEKIGLYMIAFIEGLNKATEPYWRTVVSLEEEIRDPVCRSLQYVWSRIYGHSELLTGLKKLVNDVDNRKLRGCLLLQYIQSAMSYYVGTLRESICLIVETVNKVFYHQIFCWMVYGQLVDSYDEFFIKENSSCNRLDTPFDRFSINLPMLPAFMTQSFAEKILQVGQTVLFLRSNPRMAYHKEQIDPKADICITGDDLMRRKEKQLQKKIEELHKVPVWNERNIMATFLGQISACVNKELWTLARQDAKVADQLRLVKEFFLLGRGELFHEFVVQVDQNFARGLAGSNESTIDSDLNSILQEAVQKVHVKEDFLQRFRLEYKKSGNEEKPMNLGGEWSNVTVKYDIPWPLQILFTPSVLHTYNRIFPFLLRLKKIQVKLVNCWLSQKTIKSEYDRRRIFHRDLWFLINNLQYYLHVDVLESQFEIFESAVKYSKNFDEIEKAHTIFLQNLVAQLFLYEEVGSNPAKTAINKNMNKILKICEEFCHEVEVHGDKKIESTKLKNMILRFECCVEFLLKLLSKFSNEDSYPGNQYLAQFLLRFDYNSFFTQKITCDMKMLYL